MQGPHVKLSKDAIIVTECQCIKIKSDIQAQGSKITKIQWNDNHQDEVVHATSAGTVYGKWGSVRYIVDG